MLDIQGPTLQNRVCNKQLKPKQIIFFRNKKDKNKRHITEIETHSLKIYCRESIKAQTHQWLQTRSYSCSLWLQVKSDQQSRGPSGNNCAISINYSWGKTKWANKQKEKPQNTALSPLPERSKWKTSLLSLPDLGWV